MNVITCNYEPTPSDYEEIEYDEESDMIHQNELIDEFTLNKNIYFNKVL